MEMLTIAQASELTGKSEHAVRRLIKHLLERDQHAGEHIKQEPIANDSFRYSIEKNYLLLHIPQPDAQTGTQANEQSNEHLAQPHMQGDTEPHSRLNGQNSTQNLQPYMQGYEQLLRAKDDTIDVLKSQLKQRDEQLKQKDEQIRKKDEQLSQLLERDRETNILLKGYQDRYLLEAPRGQQAAKQGKETDRQVSKPPQKAKKKPEQPQKKGFFSFLRGK